MHSFKKITQKKPPPKDYDITEEELLNNKDILEINTDFLYRKIIHYPDGKYTIKHIDKIRLIEVYISSTGDWYLIQKDIRDFVFREHFYYGNHWFESTFNKYGQCIERINNYSEKDYFQCDKHCFLVKGLVEIIEDKPIYIVSIRNLNLQAQDSRIIAQKTDNKKDALNHIEKWEKFLEVD